MSIFSKMFQGNARPTSSIGALYVDMHSHLLPGIDDGVDDYEESIKIITALMELGYKKLITTPHIMVDYYRNTPEIINGKLAELRIILKERGIEVEVDAAAEYYMDDNFKNLLKEGDMLTFGNNYILVETSYLSEVNNLKDAIFSIQVAGYKPVLAHPERYIHMYDDFEKYKELFEKDIYFQVNLGSLIGYYSKESKKIAERLIKEKMVHFLGTDAHHTRHIKPITEAIGTGFYQQAIELNLLNNTLA